MKKFVIVNLQLEGVHHWPECDIEEVSFLKEKHRHMFFIGAKKEVSHGDREIEIIQLKRKILDWVKKKYGGDFETMSCEDIATVLLEEFDLESCVVLEDGENGAMVKK